MSIVQLKVKRMCYYGSRLHDAGAIIDFDTDHCRTLSDGSRPMPLWGELVFGQEPVEAETPKTEFKETTLHEMAKSPGPNVRKANTGKKVSSKQK